MSSTNNSSSGLSGVKHRLPAHWVPTEHDVIINARGRKAETHPGNLMFRCIIDEELESYALAESKADKSSVLNNVIQRIKNHSACCIGFVKRDPRTGHYFCADDSASRCAIAQAFRDKLSAKHGRDYKSSRSFKKCLRLERKRSDESQRTVEDASESSYGAAGEDDSLCPAILKPPPLRATVSQEVPDPLARTKGVLNRAPDHRCDAIHDNCHRRVSSSLVDVPDDLFEPLPFSEDVPELRFNSSSFLFESKTETDSLFPRLNDFGEAAHTSSRSMDDEEALSVLGNLPLSMLEDALTE